MQWGEMVLSLHCIWQNEMTLLLCIPQATSISKTDTGKHEIRAQAYLHKQNAAWQE